MNSSILIYSGGLDSTVLLYKLLSEGFKVKCLTVNYGQKHKKEIESAKYFCSKLNVEHEIVDVSNITKLISSSSLTSNIEVPEGHYAEESMKSTVVPNRNMIMLSIAIGWAINIKYNYVAYAAHNGDHAIYPDCREEFVNHVSSAAELADWHPVKIIRPFINLSKTQIVKLGNELNVPMNNTWSCYKGNDLHCGKCGTCNERIEAFELAGIEDKTIYI
jgi:7-cyano-7-deazaguanine synthase